jgi:hypothetical protein
MYDDYQPDGDDHDPWDPAQVEIDMRVAAHEYDARIDRLLGEIDDLTAENAALREELGRAHGLR